MPVNGTALVRSRMYLPRHKVWPQSGLQTFIPSCLLQSLKKGFAEGTDNIFFFLVLAVGQWHFQMTFCIIYNYTCVKNTLSLNFLFNYLMCKPHFREFSPPVLFSGNHWVCNSINLSYINSGLSLRFLFYVCFLINHEQKWGSSLSKTTSGRTTSSLCNFSVRENVWFGGFFFFQQLSYLQLIHTFLIQYATK